MEDRDRDIYSYITSEETAYGLPITVVDGYEWNMKEHVDTTVLYNGSKYRGGNPDDNPYKNIIRPILNLQHRAEGFDVKDVDIYVNDSKQYYKSFITKKYHEKWAVDNNIDTFIDDLVEGYCDFGGVLVKKLEGQPAPEVVQLQTIAFCDQSDVLGGPLGIKHFFSPDRLKEMADAGWGDVKNGATVSIDELITLSKEEKKSKAGAKSKTPGKYIEVYEIHGMLPESFLKEDGDEDKYSRQMQIVAFYTASDGRSEGVTLFAGKESETPFKFLSRDKIYGRGLGMGGAEELFESQVWVNYSMIAKKKMLDAASATFYKTTDQNLKGKNLLNDKENGEVIFVEDGGDVSQIDTFPRNITAFDNATAEWEAHAQTTGAANEAIMGESPKSGTPFKLQELVTAEAHSLHEYRKGQLAVFVSEIYRDWIIPAIMKDVTTEQEFLSELTPEELEFVADALMTNQANEFIIESILGGRLIQPEEVELHKEGVREKFMKGGNKKFIKILKDDLKKTPVDVAVNIVGKQKYLSQNVDKLVNVFRQLISAPQVLDDPRMAKIFNQIIEGSGLTPVDFYRSPQAIQAQQAQQAPQQGAPAPTDTAPLKALAEQNV